MPAPIYGETFSPLRYHRASRSFFDTGGTWAFAVILTSIALAIVAGIVAWRRGRNRRGRLSTTPIVVATPRIVTPIREPVMESGRSTTPRLFSSNPKSTSIVHPVDGDGMPENDTILMSPTE
eukprot:Sspe_Gene.26081::Locus_10654_Transcript_5_6_Confidence_0.375_Length_1125::g.26081::m.26081